ncbi:MAG: hypothetical protein Q9205_004157 [Flavoplaca limonia]
MPAQQHGPIPEAFKNVPLASPPPGVAGIIGYVSVVIASLSQPGGGKHLWDTVIGDYSDEGFIQSVVSTAIYGPVIFCVKLALFLLYLHLFGRLRWLKWLVWWGIAITGLFHIPAIFIAFIFCAPRGGQTWLERSMTSKCRNGLQDYGVAQGVVGVGGVIPQDANE